MRAAVVEGPGRVRIVHVPRPRPGAGAALVKLEGCGVCASNLEPWAGPDWMSFPTEPGGLGHEGWGEVVEVGEGVTQALVGRRAVLLGSHSFAEFDAGRVENLVLLPESFPRTAFPGEAFGCAFNIFRRAEVREGQTLAIVGLGFLGLILTRLASDAGARVIGLSRRQSSLDHGLALGASAVIPMHDHGTIIETVKTMTDGRLCERVIEAVGRQWPLDLASELTGEMGRLVIAGYHQDGPRQVNMQLWNWRGLDVVNAHERRPEVYLRGVEEAVAAVLGGRLAPEGLVTHRYPLDRLDEALDATRDKPGDFIKAVVVP